MAEVLLLRLAEGHFFRLSSCISAPFHYEYRDTRSYFSAGFIPSFFFFFPGPLRSPSSCRELPISPADVLFPAFKDASWREAPSPLMGFPLLVFLALPNQLRAHRFLRQDSFGSSGTNDHGAGSPSPPSALFLFPFADPLHDLNQASYEKLLHLHSSFNYV